MQLKEFIFEIRQEAQRQMMIAYKQRAKYDNQKRPALELAVDAVVENVAIKFSISKQSVIYFLLWDSINGNSG